MDAIYLALSTIFTVLLYLGSPTAVNELQRAALSPPAQMPMTTITTTLTTTKPMSVTFEDASAGMSAVLERLYDADLSTPDTPPTALSKSQRAATICRVTSPADAGDGTLRVCLLNAIAGDLIEFDPVQFPPFNPMSITLSTPLPIITVDSLLIDGSNAGVVLLGDSLSAGDGLVVDGADGVVIRGLQIKRFPGSGIVLKGGTTNSVIGGDRGVGSAPLGQGNLLSENDKSGVQIEDAESRDNLVIGNYIGVDLSGTQAAGNFVGISVLNAISNTIGSGAIGQGNLISANLTNGILVHAATGNQILGNTIGTDHSGTLPLGNAETGISLYEGASSNIIGGLKAGEGNLLSDHKQEGIYIAFTSNQNRVIGNFIGTDRSGLHSLGNRRGILVSQAQYNVIGGVEAGTRNLISGNIREEASSNNIGIAFDGGAAYNKILGNYVGVDISGEALLPNAFGIVILDSHHNIIGGVEGGAGNLVSGNLKTGIYIDGLTSVANQVLGNLVGTDRHGQTRLGNTDGIAIVESANQTVIGGTSSGARNIISGNETGINLQDSDTSQNQIVGNYIGTNISGTQAISNAFGIYIGHSATHNVIGGHQAGARNLISGNDDGIRIENSTIITGNLNNQVLGNYIGVDASGFYALGNQFGIYINASSHNQIDGNLISGGVMGISLVDPPSHHNQIIGNLIGTDFSGTYAPALQQTGIAIDEGANNNIVGGLQPEERNLISGNIQGVSLARGATQNQILGNYIGTTITGTAALPNDAGVVIVSGATENIVGHTMAGGGNLISGNSSAGVLLGLEGTTKNQILGNLIGTDVSGTESLGNGNAGIFIGNGATANQIGGEIPSAGNLISGNGNSGIVLLGEGTAGNLIQGNAIGTDRTKLKSIPNGTGVLMFDGPDANFIGGESSTTGNVISGNLRNGINLTGPHTINNQIQNNQIGLAGDGFTPLGNGGAGIVLTDTTKLNTIGISNTIAYNAGAGIFLSTTETSANTITRNQIHDNQGGQIVWATVAGTDGPNFTVRYFQAATGVITGTTCAGCTVEFFANPTPTDAGTLYLGSTTTGRGGAFTMDLGGSAPLPHLTATVTKPDRTTFGFYPVQMQQSYLYLPVIAR